MKEALIKFVCFFTGVDWRKFFPERWDLSKIMIFNAYGGNEGFIKYYKDPRTYTRFVNGIDVVFYDNSFVVKKIVGWTRSGFCNIAMNKDAIKKAFR